MSALTLHSFKNPLPSIEPFIPASTSDNQREYLLTFDRWATERGERILAEVRGVEALRIKIAAYEREGLSRWLIESNKTLADQLERDVRFAGYCEFAPQVRNSPDSLGARCTHLYLDYLEAAVAARETLRAQLVGSVALALQAAG